MNIVELSDSAFTLDAKLIAEDLGLTPVGVLERMRSGQLTSLCERGIAEDAGRWRLTFFHRHRCLRLIVDDQGQVIQRSTARSRMGSRTQQITV
jgi:hypothetical protein